MRVNKPELHPMVRGALMEIQSAGVEITPEIVVWVQDAACAMRKMPHRPDSEIIDFPVQCGGAWLYPLSFAAVHWVSQLPEKMQNDSRVLAFACAHSKDRETLEKLQGSLITMLAVVRWVMTLTCSMTALKHCVDRLIGFSESVDVPAVITRTKKDQDDDWQFGPIIKSLCAKYPGTSPEYWMWEVSREKACNLIAIMQDELPENLTFTEYEVQSQDKFRSIIEAIKAGTVNG